MKVQRDGPVRITKATIDAAWRRRAKDARLVIGDATCRGLALVVNSASMAWTFSYKPRGTDPTTGRRFATRSVTIGNPKTHSPDAARAAANALKGEAQAGGDPAATRRAASAAASERRARTAGRVLELYKKALPARPSLRGGGPIGARHVANEIGAVTAAIAAMRAEDKPLGEIGAADVRRAVAAAAGMPSVARHRFGALSRFFDWCQDEGHVGVNPCAMVAKPRRPRGPNARSHFLGLGELAGLWRAAGEAEDLEPVHRDFIRFLIAVPCRRGEAAGLNWAHLDLAAGVWTQPGKLTKNRDPHRLHLHPIALGILRARHEAAGKPAKGLVFPAPRSGKALSAFSGMKATLGAASGLSGWRWHDFRRSFATALGEAGVAEPVVDAVLNHRQAATRGGVLGVYQRASRWPEQRCAMDAWGALLAAALDGREIGTVVALCRPA
jgi:integrase